MVTCVMCPIFEYVTESIFQRKKAMSFLLRLLVIPQHRILRLIKNALLQKQEKFGQETIHVPTDLSTPCHLVLTGAHGSGKSSFVKGIVCAFQFGCWRHPLFEVATCSFLRHFLLLPFFSVMSPFLSPSLSSLTIPFMERGQKSTFAASKS